MAEIILGLPQGRFDAETTGNVGKVQGGLVRNAVPDYTLIQGGIVLLSMLVVPAAYLLMRRPRTARKPFVFPRFMKARP